MLSFMSPFQTSTHSTRFRPTPPRTQPDRDMPNISEIKSRIGMLYNSRVTSAKERNPTIPFTPLTTDQISSMQCTPKTKNCPLKLYYEFQDPSNGTTSATTI